jgi:hypothetical protein
MPRRRAKTATATRHGRRRRRPRTTCERRARADASAGRSQRAAGRRRRRPPAPTRPWTASTRPRRPGSALDRWRAGRRRRVEDDGEAGIGAKQPARRRAASGAAAGDGLEAGGPRRPRASSTRSGPRADPGRHERARRSAPAANAVENRPVARGAPRAAGGPPWRPSTPGKVAAEDTEAAREEQPSATSSGSAAQVAEPFAGRRRAPPPPAPARAAARRRMRAKRGEGAAGTCAGVDPEHRRRVARSRRGRPASGTSRRSGRRIRWPSRVRLPARQVGGPRSWAPKRAEATAPRRPGPGPAASGQRTDVPEREGAGPPLRGPTSARRGGRRFVLGDGQHAAGVEAGRRRAPPHSARGAARAGSDESCQRQAPASPIRAGHRVVRASSGRRVCIHDPRPRPGPQPPGPVRAGWRRTTETEDTPGSRRQGARRRLRPPGDAEWAGPPERRSAPPTWTAQSVHANATGQRTAAGREAGGAVSSGERGRPGRPAPRPAQQVISPAAERVISVVAVAGRRVRHGRPPRDRDRRRGAARAPAGLPRSWRGTSSR